MEEELARDALTRFYNHGIESKTWGVFSNDTFARYAYIGTPVANLFHLVQQKGSYNGVTPPLHLPFPAIRPSLPWKPREDLPILKWYSNIVANVSALPSL